MPRGNKEITERLGSNVYNFIISLLSISQISSDLKRQYPASLIMTIINHYLELRISGSEYQNIKVLIYKNKKDLNISWQFWFLFEKVSELLWESISSSFK